MSRLSRAIPVLAAALAAAALGATAALHPLAPVVLVVGLALAAWVLASPYRALLGFMLALILRPAEFFPALAALQPAKLLALGALGLWALGRLLRRDRAWPHTRLDRWMVALTLALLASSKLGSMPGESMALFQDVFVKILILYLLLVNLVDSTARAATTLQAIAAACVALGLYALYAKASGVSQVEGSRSAFVGMLGDPNDLALCLLMALPFLTAATMNTHGGRRWRYGLLTLTVLAGIVATQSRGGFLGMGAGFAILLGEKVKSRAALVAILAVGMAVLVAASGMSKRASGGGDTEGIDESAQGRLDSWYAGGRMLRRHPVLGVGFGVFADNYPRYASNTVFWSRHEAHNSFVKAAAETGLAGFVPFMALVVLSFRGAARARARRHEVADPVERAAVGALLPTLAGFFVSAFFLSQCWGWFTFILFGLTAATERVVCRLPPDPAPAEPAGAPLTVFPIHAGATP